MKRVTMNDINAYLDGALDEDKRHELEKAAEGDMEIKALLSQHRNHVEELHRLYDPVLEEPVPSRMLELLRRQKS
ncbi:NepR family anti-sigma factor [Azospirillum sp. SYSU D00513]|uniref:anti-sigma factor family protein n=1 Tax=Azospirillum sp. SYSU D00513 TaxID=2812561 RepID=UPI001A972987|nr:NepR family anti-sigma factor [Azospirillum sp. SYSU D00513]